MCSWTGAEENVVTSESREIDEDKFHRHVIISLGIMALMGVVAIALLTMLRRSVVSRGSAPVSMIDVEAVVIPPPPPFRERKVTISVPDDDDDDCCVAKKPKEFIPLACKPQTLPTVRE